ncbi:pentatricopeptide repeat-containing protein At3g14580, mitochondrial [Cajanus cajan]|nr:pentatricopeptide repeat-containing protein At3g14580, mitochondrial [Cajanus cajan]
MIRRAGTGRLGGVRLFSQLSPPTDTDGTILSRLKHKDWLTPKEATKLLTSLTHPSSTLSFFHLYTSRKDFHPTEPLCTALVTKLAQAHHLGPILSLHQALTQTHRFSDNFFYTLVKSYAHPFRRVDMSLSTLLRMPFPPSARTFNFVLNLLVAARLHDAARDLFLRAPALGVAPDACTLNILVKGLCARGEVDAAFRVLGEFGNLGCAANAWTYAALMKGLCEEGRVAEAVGMLERMEEGGVEADVAVFNVVVGGLRREGRVEEGWGLLEGMVERGVCPNEGTYNEVVCGLVEGGRVEEARGVVERMGKEGFVPSFGAYKGLVKGFCEGGMVEGVEWVLGDMVRKGFVPRMGMWRLVVKCVVDRENNGWVGGAIDGVLED